MVKACWARPGWFSFSKSPRTSPCFRGWVSSPHRSLLRPIVFLCFCVLLLHLCALLLHFLEQSTIVYYDSYRIRMLRSQGFFSKSSGLLIECMCFLISAPSLIDLGQDSLSLSLSGVFPMQPAPENGLGLATKLLSLGILTSSAGEQCQIKTGDCHTNALMPSNLHVELQ